MITVRKFTSGVLIGWVSTFLSIAVGLFMSPFLIHHLGETGYGVWVLVQSAVSYMYFMDLGLRTTVMRFSASAQARGDHEEVNNIVSGALWIRLWTAAGILPLAGAIAVALPHLFAVPTKYVVTARIALLLAATTLSSSLVFSVFSAVLSGLGRFDILGLLELAQVALTAFGLIPIIRSGHGIVAMAAWQFVVVLAVNIVTTVACFRIYPQLRCHFRRPEKTLLRSLWSLSLYVLIINGAGQLILYTDNVVVGAFIAAAAVSYYAVAGKMIEYVRLIAISILKFIMPLATAFGARDEFDRLRELHIRGSQGVILVTYPVLITLFLRGDALLRLWIGDKFSSEATSILQMLAVACALMIANSSVNGLAMALDKQRPFAIVTLIEGVANLGLSIFFVHSVGLVGVALGTLVSTALTSFIFWPPFLCRLLKLPLLTYIRDGWLRPVLALVPFTVASYWARTHWIPSHLINFVFQVAALLPLAVLGVVVAFWKDREFVLQRLRSRNNVAVV